MRGYRLIIGYKLTTYKLIWLFAVTWAWIAFTHPVQGQRSDPEEAIKALREGYLIVRLPSYRAKIDTLESMIGRSTNETQKIRLQRLLDETVESRDSLQQGYIRAFKHQYHFSKVAYFYDYDAHNLNTAKYYNLDSEPIAIGDIMDKPLYYLFFERTVESKIDALVIYDRKLTIVPRPFPNNFSRGGLNFLFLKISDKNFPAWRVTKMQKQLIRYYNAVRMVEETEG